MCSMPSTCQGSDFLLLLPPTESKAATNFIASCHTFRKILLKYFLFSQVYISAAFTVAMRQPAWEMKINLCHFIYFSLSPHPLCVKFISAYFSRTYTHMHNYAGLVKYLHSLSNALSVKGCICTDLAVLEIPYAWVCQLKIPQDRDALMQPINFPSTSTHLPRLINLFSNPYQQRKWSLWHQSTGRTCIRWWSSQREI